MLAEVVVVASTKENTWEILAPLPETGSEMRAAAANGKIYVMSGSRNFEYDPKLNEWTTKTPMPSPRKWFDIAVYQNKIYTIGGILGFDEENEIIISNAIEVYDPSTDTWKILSPMPINTSAVDACVVNGKIYLIGGFNLQFPSLSTNVNVVYDIVRDSWTNKTAMPYPAYDYSGVFDNKIYIIGGLGSSLSNRTQIYDTETDSWSLGAPIPTPVYNAAVGATTGVMAPRKIYVIGGTTGEGGMFAESMNLVQVYDPKDNTWAVGEPMPTARLGLIVAVLDDQIYAIAGMPQMAFSPWLTTNERYTPFGYGTPDPTYDGTAPEITLKSPKNETYYGPSIRLEFSVNERVSWIGYKLDNETIVEITGDTTVSGLSFGSHTLIIYATDTSGNNGASETVFFSVAEFPVVLLTAGVTVVAVVGAGLLVYFKKRKR